MSVQQTQKSFSIIPVVRPRPVPVTTNRSARSEGGNRATSSMILVLDNPADGGRNPVGGVTRVPQEFLPLFR